MDADKLFSGAYLNVELVRENNLVGKELTIIGCTVEKIGNPEKEKLQIVFDGVDEGFIPNKTNYLKIREVLGNNTDEWKGKIIVLDVTKVMYNGKITPSITIKEVKK